jgi:hypothetical protein
MNIVRINFFFIEPGVELILFFKRIGMMSYCMGIKLPEFL